MRQRRIKGIDEKILAYRHLTLSAHGVPEGFAAAYVEVGCGRGRFLNELAARDSGSLYIGIEGCASVAYRAMQKTAEAEHQNVRYLVAYINDMRDIFENNTIRGVFLNFSDPWPKDRHAERRLTSPKHAAAYYSVLCAEGFLELKTDNEGFFCYSRGQLQSAGFRIEFETRDLHGTPAYECGPTRTQTEYEHKFMELGKPICCLRGRKGVDAGGLLQTY
jgi:tRNA (guanine-N7-)-methyltransferase